MKEARAISPKFPFKHFTFWVLLDALAMGCGNLKILGSTATGELSCENTISSHT